MPPCPCAEHLLAGGARHQPGLRDVGVHHVEKVLGLLVDDLGRPCSGPTPTTRMSTRPNVQLPCQPAVSARTGRAYWRDVIMYRKTEERAGLIAGVLTTYLTDSLNQNKPWSQIATDFITATGDANENGACGLIVAQQGQPEETVAEISPHLPGRADSMCPVPRSSDRSLEARAVPRAGRVLPAGRRRGRFARWTTARSDRSSVDRVRQRAVRAANGHARSAARPSITCPT